MLKNPRNCILWYLQNYFLLYLTIWDHCNATNADADRGIVLERDIIWNGDRGYLYLSSTVILELWYTQIRKCKLLTSLISFAMSWGIRHWINEEVWGFVNHVLSIVDWFILQIAQIKNQRYRIYKITGYLKIISKAVYRCMDRIKAKIIFE